MTPEGFDRVTSRLSMTVGAAAILADATYLVFAAVGEPFGSVNDVCYAATGLLAGALAWRLRSHSGGGAAVAAVGGAALAAVGSGLVLTDTTGWLLAGLVSTVGFGLIGPSVVTASSSLSARGLIPPACAALGRMAGGLMTLGLTAAVPAAMRVDDASAAPWWTWLTMVGWVGSAFLYPAWAIWLGRASARPTLSPRIAG